MHEATRAGAPLKLLSAAATAIGRRHHNEDAVLVRADLGLYVLADGAGGHNAGNVASALATTSIANYLEAAARRDADARAPELDRFGLATAARRLATAIQGANRDIIEIANTSNKRKGMGSTVVAALASADCSSLHLAHVGDSRCYRLRGGQLELLTQDHSLINDVLELHPDMSDAALGKLPRNVVTRALGMEDPVRVAVRTHAVLPGDKYLLCSDGLTDALDDGDIADALNLSRSPEELVKLLVDTATEIEAADNIAVVVISCEAPREGSWSPRRRGSSAHARARDASPAPPPEVSLDASPEIVMLGSDDDEPELEMGAHVHVVPRGGADEALLDALDDFMGATAPARQRAARANPARCAVCKGRVESGENPCPHCGAPRT